MTMYTVALLLTAITLSVSAEFLLKRGMMAHGELDLSLRTVIPTLGRVLTNPLVVAGFGLAFSGAIFWLGVLSRAPLSVAYPMLSLSYALGLLIGLFFLGERVSGSQWVGVLIIIAGVKLVSGF